MLTKRITIVTYAAIVAASLLVLYPKLSLAVSPSDADEWAAKDPITVTITSATNTYLAINKTKSLSATATDPDCYRVDSTWYNYSDQVTSGNNSTDYHIWWTASEGTFPDMYGTSATYEAPDYAAGSSVRNVTVTAHADDFDRGDETPTDAGYAESADTDSITVKVWQIHVGGHIFGTTDSSYDGTPVPTAFGGTDLGWITPNNPAGATGYHCNTELYGSIPSAISTTSGFNWYNYKQGIVRHKTNASEPNWATPYDYNHPSSYEFDFGPAYSYLDADPRHPNTTGTNVHKIFAMDAPGAIVGLTNDAGIPPWTYLDFEMFFKAWVEMGGVRVSNEAIWCVFFDLDEVGGNWSEVSHGLLI